MTSAIDKRVTAFFEAYATASLAGDAAAVSDSYFSTYIEAAPSAVEAFKVDAQYKRAVTAKAEAMRKMGLTESVISVMRTTPLAPSQLLVEAQWRLLFEPEGKKTAETTFRISYVVHLGGDDLKILLALSHEDEEKALQKLDLA